MSNINQINEQLFAELTAEEGSAISGGKWYKYTIGNKSGMGVNYNIKYLNQYGKWTSKKEYVGAYKKDYFYALNKPFVTYDAKIGKGYELNSETLTKGYNNFDRTGNYLILTTGEEGPVANITA